jgi:hypothetical protein
MSREQYLKIIERELHEINKRIDMKILSGQEYRREAKAHKMLLLKIRQHSPHKGFFGRFITAVPQFLMFF